MRRKGNKENEIVEMLAIHYLNYSEVSYYKRISCESEKLNQELIERLSQL